jgi:hypothetical protein
VEPRADQTAEILERLRTGAAGHACAGFLTTLDPLHLADLLTGLVYDRLRRKYDAAAEIYRISGQNWNQTFYTLLFRYIGDLSNQDTYTELARRATYTMVLRERRSLPRIEALLFGTSGLLDTFRPDDYIRRLRDDFAYFRARYDIEPIDPSAWKTANIRPGNLPRLRIAQLASFLSQHDFVFEQLLACRTPGGEPPVPYRSVALLVRSQTDPGRTGGEPQTGRTAQNGCLRYQRGQHPAIRLRLLHPERRTPRPGYRPAGMYSRRREQIHEAVDRSRSQSPQRIRHAGVDPTVEGILRRTTLRMLSRRAADHR